MNQYTDRSGCGARRWACPRWTRIVLSSLCEARRVAAMAIITCAATPVATASISVHRQDQVATACPDVAMTSCTIAGQVVYLPPFFSQFNPITALDMVRRVPGFSIDPGESVRGFGGAAGNVLIDGQRPSTKSADIFDTLRRIGANRVDRIELIRGGTGGLDVGGQAVVVNLILKQGSGSSSTPWEFSLTKRRPGGGVRPGGEISRQGQWGKTKYTMGAEVFAISLLFDGVEDITRFAGPDETRLRDGRFREQGGAGNFKIEHPFANGDIARFNVESSYFRFRDAFDETRILEQGGPDLAFFDFAIEGYDYEIGADYEHAITDTLDVKVIGLFSREFEEFVDDFRLQPATGVGTASQFISDRTFGETVGRVEFGFSGWDSHAIQFGGEVASNFIDSTAELLRADDDADLMPVAIPGANTRVSELRGEPFVSDSWKISPKLTLDSSFALELSRIAQSGDNANARFFTYPKPSLTLTYAPRDKTQLRLSGEREVNQLSFGEFVSSVNFDDEDVDFGNPDLQPQRTWAFALSLEQRFGEIGVVELIGFYDYVQDVEDLLPIGGIVEVPGNIGDGQIYGTRLNVTLPFDWLGLTNSRIESQFVYRDSAVTDPVTGLDRDFSFREDFRYSLEYRQDFPAKKFSWGMEAADRAQEFSFGLDEVSRFTVDTEFNMFVETTQIKGIKARFEINDITNVTNLRERTVFDGSRAIGVPLFQEDRTNNNGGSIRLILSGTL